MDLVVFSVSLEILVDFSLFFSVFLDFSAHLVSVSYVFSILVCLSSGGGQSPSDILTTSCSLVCLGSWEFQSSMKVYDVLFIFELFIFVFASQ